MGTLSKKFAGCRRSITIWFNSVALAILPALDYAKDSLPLVRDYLDGELFKTVGLIIVVGNIILRFKTDRPLESK